MKPVINDKFLYKNCVTGIKHIIHGCLDQLDFAFIDICKPDTRQVTVKATVWISQRWLFSFNYIEIDSRVGLKPVNVRIAVK